MKEVIFFLQLTEYKDKTLFGSDIPLRWFMDVIVVCLSILLFILTYKIVVAVIRYSFYMLLERSKYKEVLKEAVNVSQTLLDLYDGKNTVGEYSESQWYTTISKAYRSLGRIEKIANKTGLFQRDKKRIANIYSSLNEILEKCDFSKGGKNIQESAILSLQKVNIAIVDYLK